MSKGIKGFQKGHEIKSSGSKGKHWKLNKKAKKNHSKAMKNNPKLINSMKLCWLNPEYRKKVTESVSGEKNYLFGKHRSKKIRKKISKSLSGENHPNFGKQRLETTKNKIRITRMKQILPRKDTSIEIKLREELDKLKVRYETHKSILGQPDIFIEPNICVFADGDYWHNRSERKIRDEYVNKKLKKMRYLVLRFWEHEINSDSHKCAKQILNIL